MKNKIIKIIRNSIFIFVMTIFYVVAYSIIYGSPFMILIGAEDFLIMKYYLFLGILPAYLLLRVMRTINKGNKINFLTIVWGETLLLFTIKIIDSILHIGVGYTEFRTFFLMPALLSNFFFFFFVVKWVKSWEEKIFRIN